MSAATDGFRAFTSETARRVAIVKHPRDVPTIKFIDQRGEVLSLDQYRGKLILVDFIFTRCPDVCHSLGLTFKNFRDRLKELGLDEQVKLLSISFDPEYDHEEQLSLYLKRYGPVESESWSAVRTFNVNELPGLLSIFSIDVIANEFGGYDHNAAIHLIDEQGRLIKIFDYAVADQVIAEIRRQFEV